MVQLRIRGGTSTSSSGFSRTSTTASTPVVSSLRVHRKRLSTELDSPDTYYRAIIRPTNETWDMLTKFTDCEVIGRGSYGEVVCANFSEVNYQVAIKRVDILEDDQASDWENGLRLVREIYFLKHLEHPNLSSLVCLFPNTGPDLRQVHIVTRYFDQGSLNEYAPVDLPEVVEIFSQVLSGLAYMHSHGVLHRDVKRENVFVSRSPDGSAHVVLGDFGLARSRIKGGMTAEVVTKPYRCPSLLLGASHYGSEIDVYAAGIVLLEMLTGKLKSTLLPNRKMALKNFVRFQLALSYACRDISGRLLALSENMHLGIEELIEEMEKGSDFDNILAMEWGRQTWSTVSEVYKPDEKLLSIARKMVTFDPSFRCSLDYVLRNLNIDASKETVTSPVKEKFDEEISVLETDEKRADTIKNTLRRFMDPTEPVSRRTRLQIKRRGTN